MAGSNIVRRTGVNYPTRPTGNRPRGGRFPAWTGMRDKAPELNGPVVVKKLK